MNTVNKKYRIKSRSRFTIFIVIALLVVTTLTTTVLGLNNAKSLSQQEYTQIEVQNGDTLWTIACEYMPGKDPRQSVHTISKLNDTSAEDLYPGQVLDIPTEI